MSEQVELLHSMTWSGHDTIDTDSSGEDLSKAIVVYRRNEEICQPHVFGGDIEDGEEDVLGKGSYGVVYKVRCGTCQGEYARKVITLDSFMREESRKRHLRATDLELQCYMYLDHPHILSYVHHEIDNKRIEIYTEFCGHGDLQELLCEAEDRGTHMPDEFVWHILEGLASALARCHFGLKASRRDVIYSGFESSWNAILHRDIKPGNILLSQSQFDGSVEPIAKLGDFGTSFKLEENGRAPSTQMAGTKVYWAPEIAEEEKRSRTITKWSTMSDIWAVGAVLHIMLTYEIPTQDQPRGLIARISKLDSLRPMDRAPISELLSLVVGECLSPSEKDRPSALQLLAVAMKSDCSLESYQRSESFWQVMATDADSELSSMVVARFVYKHLPIMAKHRIRFSPKEIVLIMNLTYRYCRSHLTSCHQNLCSGFLEGSAGDLTGGTVFHALVCLQGDDDLLLQTLQDDNWPSAKELSTCALKKNREGLLPSALAAKAQSNALYVWMEANEDRARAEKSSTLAKAKLDELRKQLEAHASEEFESTFRLMTSMTLDHRVSSSHMARAMTESARHGYFNLARKLMEIGVNPSARGSRMETALHISAWRGDIAMVRLLLGKGAEVDARDKDRRTPLQWASWAGKEETARELLSKNANVNARDTENRTALYGAAGGGFTEVVRCLILHKADATIRGGRGRETALERARNKKYNDVVALLSS